MAFSPGVPSIIEALRSREGLLTIAQASEILHVHPVTLRDWIRAKRLSAFLVGNQWRIDPAALAEWLLSKSV